MKSGICSCGAIRVRHSLVGFGGGGLAPTDSRTDYTLLSLRSEISVLATRENSKLKPEENDK